MQADRIIYIYIYIPQTKFGGYIEISCPSVLSVRSPVLHLSVQNSCQVHIFFYKWNSNFLLHTNIVYDRRVCHVLFPRSFGQGQWQWQENCKICVRSLFFEWISICSYFAQTLLITCLHIYYLWLKRVSWPCTKVIWGRSMAVKAQKSYPVLIFKLRKIRNFYFTQISLMTWGRVLTLALKVVWASLRLLKRKVYNLCLFRTVFMEKYRKFLFQIKIAYGPLTCPEHDPESCMHE